MTTKHRSQDILLLDETANLKDYEEAARNARWQDAEQYFSWHDTGKVNMVYEAIDRHVDNGQGQKLALLYADGIRDEQYTYQQLRDLSCKFANGLRSLGIQKGDRVFIFMPRSPELYIAMLGIIRIGAIAGPLFEAFMEEAVKDRLLDSRSIAVVTTSELLYRIPVDSLPDLNHVILANGNEITGPKQVLYRELLQVSDEYVMEWVDREDGMILHYTSGSTGKPKGVLQVHDAMLHQYMAGKWVYDLREGDIYWCTADPGWVTGTSAGMWSPWLNGVTTVLRGGRFKPADWYATIEKFKVTVWFSAPTALRMLMGEGDELPKQYDLSSVRHILSAGEPLNPEVVRWGLDVLERRIHDNWWMTETGASTCANYRSMPIRPGSMGKPLPGIKMAIVDDEGNELPPNTMGNLAIKPSWPAMMRKIWNNPAKYEEYFATGWYMSGDSAYMDQDGYFWFEGRVDDVINTSGERVGPFDVESKLVEHPAVAEAGVIGVPDPVRGEIIKAFIKLRAGFEETDKLKEEIRLYVKERLAAHAAPRQIEFRDRLPKTRSGKIMRRVLKAWELGLPTGDLSTMED
ncbi:acetate--CoA ligase [Aneurinibacillus sp. Ricciae_BoGa-3]|uniref:acetate--CoA ligase n=1 Tax=Aneurinibacillus sp. Ricciae_BoGa-3 TaxID=3022697 RepID=UPI002342883E|nr:acetate--CoA ligase [Aneurinibacillus sp. Ricciae_BoGa-3]WCK53381.1 acetate--CoA ligase [Aneurinibacillus sp. Ricciae_BoGa-3]